MQIFTSPATMRQFSRERQCAGLRIGCVPTMGALHEGHLALIRRAQELSDLVVVSIFVNPLQFNKRDDFDHYPRPMDGDLDACRHAGVDAVYAPTPAVMYPPGFQTHVEPGELAEPLEGANRPGHFRGVATVVTKLFNAVRPDVAVFGLKDYQQLAVIRQMAADLDQGIEIVGLPTVREHDGLALSSRNLRLSAEQRRAAIAIPRALDAIEAAVTAGQRDVVALDVECRRVLAGEPLALLEHVEFVDPHTLRPRGTVDGPLLVVIAVWMGDVRLIDNRLIDHSAER